MGIRLTSAHRGEGFLGCSATGRTGPDHRLAVAGEHPFTAAAGTIFFPDVSGYQGGLRVPAGTAALLAKATEGQTFTDGSYAGFRAQAATVGAVFAAYHFVWGGSVAEAKHVYGVVGKTPLMLDVENTAVPLHIGDVTAFVKNYRALGGVVHLAYLPHWYWQGTMGSPSLLPLAQLGVHIVSSNYTAYSDNGPGWASYGGVAPAQWQYTDAYPYGGMPVDFNAFKGTAASYRALLTGVTPTPAPTPTPQAATKETEMVIVQVDRNTVPKGGTWPGWFLLTSQGRLIHIPPAQAKTNGDKTQSDNLEGLKQAGISEGGYITYSFYQQLVDPAAAG
jgi:hypothetical protein